MPCPYPNRDLASSSARSATGLLKAHGSQIHANPILSFSGPLILNGFGFNKYTTSLLNIPFGFVQLIIILAASWAAQKFKWKSITLFALVLPVVAGLAMLYTIPHKGHTGALLAGYYLLAFLFGGNPLIVAWIVGNTAGTTKKSVIMSCYNAASSAGESNITQAPI